MIRSFAAPIAVVESCAPRLAARRRLGPVGGVTGIARCVSQLSPATWVGVTLNVVAMVVLGRLLLRWSRCRGWGRRHVPAAAGSAPVVRAGLSFPVEPLGDVDDTMKYAVNAVLFGGGTVPLLVAAQRLCRQEQSAC